MDNANYNPIPVVDELVQRGLPLVGQDGISFLSAHAVLANSNNLPGSPYSFEMTGSANASFSYEWAKELSRMRAALFEEGRARDITGSVVPGYRAWALESEPCLRGVNALVLNSGELILQQRGELMRLREPEFIFPVHDGDPIKALVEMELHEISIDLQGNNHRPWIIKSAGHHRLFKRNQQATGSDPSRGVGDVMFSADVPLRADMLRGRLDLFEATGTSVSDRYYLHCSAKGDPFLGAEELFDLRVTVPSFRYVWIYVGEEKTESGAALARVIHSSKQEWRRISFLGTERLGIQFGEPSVFNERLDTGGLSGSIVCRTTAGAPAAHGGVGYWRSRGAPVGQLVVDVVQGKFESWKRARRYNHSDTGVWPNGGKRIGGASRAASTAVVRCAVGALEDNAYSDGARTSAGSTWGSYQVIDVVVPEQALGPSGFALPALMLEGASVGGGATNCRYYKIPLPGITRAQASEAQWNQNVGPSLENPAKSFARSVYAKGAEDGNIADALFHDARLTTVDGGTFWYRDLFTTRLDVRGELVHFRHWQVAADPEVPNGFALFLLLDEREVAVGRDELGAYVMGQRSFWPQEQVSQTEFAAAWGERRTLWGRIWGDNLTEFQAPFRHFDSSPSAPIASWTVGKNPGGAWVPGMRLRLYLPKVVSRVDTVDFMEVWKDGWDATILPDRLIGGSFSRAGTGDGREVYDIDVRRLPHKSQVVVLRSGVGQLAYWPVTDLRLSTVSQADADSWLPEYPEGMPADWRATPFGRVSEVYPGDWEVNESGQVTVESRAGEEFAIVMATYQSRADCPAGLEIEVGLQDVDLNWYPWGRVTIEPQSQSVLLPFFNGDLTRDQRWIVAQEWPACYRRVLSELHAEVELQAHMFSNGIDGALAWVTVTEDATVRYRVTWKGKKEDGSDFTRSFVTEHDFYQGRSMVPPLMLATFAWDETLTAEEIAGQRLTNVEVVSARRNFAVSFKYREVYPDPFSEAEVSGLPSRVHYNETLRMLKGWVAEQG